MKTIYKNLLISKQSVVVTLEDGVSVPMNDQLYSEWDNEAIIYTFKPVFGSKEDVWIQTNVSDIRGKYIQDKNIVVFDPNHIEDFDYVVKYQGVILLDNLDTLLFLDEFEELRSNVDFYDYVYTNLNLYSYFHPRNSSCKIDTSFERFGHCYIDTDENLPF